MSKRIGHKFDWIILFSTLLACSPSDRLITIHPVKEAYRLIDQGKNALAIHILEETIAKDPGNSEARIVLASAYVGEAGVDVFKIYDNFKDIIFDKPMSERFWSDTKNTPSRDPPASKENTKLELFILQLDSFLLSLSQVTTFLSRFPDVEKIKWGLLDRALESLDFADSTQDVCIYRVFIRVIYLRAYLSQELIANPLFGSRYWACNLEIEHIRESLAWVLKNLVSATEAFQEADFDRAHSLAEFQGTVSGIVEALEQARSSAPVGVDSGSLELQKRLREAFQWSRRFHQQSCQSARSQQGSGA